MTSVTTAPPSGPAVPPESARRVRTASGGTDRVYGRPLRGAGLLVLLIMSTIGSQLIFVPAAFAQGFVPISGAGSTASFNALDQWRRNVDNLTFSPDGTDLLANNAPQPPDCDRKGGPAQCTTGTGGAQTPTPPGGPPMPAPGGPPIPPRGPPMSPRGSTSCLAAIHLLFEALPRAVGATSLNGNGQWVWRDRVADEVAATTTRTYHRHLRAQLRCDSLLKRVAKTAGSPPVQVIDR